MPGPTLRDARGCLTEAGLALLRSAAPGQAPPELARHVASCSRCQERLLAADLAEGAKSRRREPPPVWRVLALFAFGVAFAFFAFWWIRRLLGAEP